MDGRSRTLEAPGRPSSGFTLVELVAIVAMTGVLAVVAAPSLSNLLDQQQSVDATRVRNLLIFAQKTAMASDVDTWVTFDVSANTASAFIEDPDNPGKTNRLALSDPLTHSSLVLNLGASGSSISSADFDATNEVRFDQLGAPYDADGAALAADGTVLIGAENTVRVTRTTGLVTLD